MHTKSTQTIERMVSKVLEVARDASWQAEVVEYPKSTMRKSIDIALHSMAFIKIIDSALKLTPNEIRDLKKASYTLNVSPVIVAERIGRQKLEEGVVYDKNGVPMISVETLALYARGSKVFIYSKRGTYYVRINAAMLKYLRMKKGMSLGELAYRIGVSRKAVYEYERGNMDVTLETAERIYEVLGEDSVFEGLDIFSMRPEVEEDEESEIHSLAESKIVRELRSLGMTTHHLKHTAADIVASKDNHKYIFVVTDQQTEEQDLKIRESTKLSKATSSKLIVLARDRSRAEGLIDEYSMRGAEVLVERIGNLNKVISEIKMHIRR